MNGRGSASNQRWRDGRTSFTGGLIATRAYEVARIDGDNVPKAFVEQHHYSGSYPAARDRFGLYNVADAELVGVAVFSHPPSEAVLARLPCERMAGIELGRFVLLNSVLGNGESWFLARCFELLRAAGIEALVSHSDPLPRRRADTSVILPGHVGMIYQATNAIYAGRTKPRILNLLPDGTVFSERSMSKIRGLERGWRYCVAQLVDAGADPMPYDIMPKAELTAWMWAAIGKVCRRVKHGGNHRYLWALDKHLRRDIAKLASGDPYPKQVDKEAA